MKQVMTSILALLMLLMGAFDGGGDREEPDAPAAGDEIHSRYAGMQSGASMIWTERGEAAFMAPGRDDGFWFSDHQGNPAQVLREAAVPNVETDARTLDGTGVTALQLNARLCGVAVEPSKSGDFELSTVGLSNGLSIAVETGTAEGVLTLTCTGTVPEAVYVNTTADERVNTVRLGVPAGALERIGVDCGGGSVLISDIDVPVTGVETSGLTRVMGETVSAPIEMECGNGCLLVQGETVSADVTLSAQNGSVYLDGGTVTGRAQLSAQNGSVTARAGRLDNARLEAYNGQVEAEVGAVGDRVYAGVVNGNLSFRLTKEPEDLTFRLSGGWRRNGPSGYWDDDDKWVEEGEEGGLPEGWYDGWTVGTGEPVLELSAASNGTLDLKLGEKSP